MALGTLNSALSTAWSPLAESLSPTIMTEPRLYCKVQPDHGQHQELSPHPSPWLVIVRGLATQIMDKIKSRFRTPPRWLVVVLALATLPLFGLLDALSPTEFSFTIFYLVPICFVAWFAGRTWGFLLAFAGVATRMLADYFSIYPFQNKEAILWHASLSVTIFPVVVYLVAALKAARQLLEKRVQERTAALQAEVAERQSAEEILRTLAVQLSAAEDAERRSLAIDMHDSVGQSLSVLKINLETLASGGCQPPDLATGGRQPPDTPPTSPLTSPGYYRMAQSLRLLDDIIKQTRSLTFNLYPAMLDDLGLVPTLLWYGEQLEAQTGVQTTVSELGEPQTLPSSLANYLFRSCKELLNNAAKHGHAQEIIVAVHWQPEVLRIVIDDDGGGFEPDKVLQAPVRHGLGLAGIRERLTSLGGRMCIESEQGQGTRVILEVSLTPTRWGNVLSS